MTSKQNSSKQPILVPVDFSPDSEAALLFGCELAEALRCPLKVLHVVHDPGEAPGFYAGKREEQGLRRMEDVAAEMMDEFMKDIVAKHPELKILKSAETILSIGLPVTRILEAAEQTEARMLVVGSKGRTGLAHILVGSKAEQLVRLCPIPVVIIKRQAE